MSTNFTWLDWAIVAVYLVASIAIGVWANRYVGNLSDYLVAGRTLKLRLALATMTGTELGLVTVMYSSELGFTQQFASLYLTVIEGTSLLIIGMTGIVVYRLRAAMVLTIPEYYEQRYSQGVRVLGGVMMVTAGVLNMGLFLKAGSQFLTAISGLPQGDFLNWIMTVLLLLVLFYTVLGGMVSVVITDLIQFIVLGTAMIIVTLFVFTHIGYDGFAKSFQQDGMYVNPFQPDNPSHLGQIKKGGNIGTLTVVTQATVLFTALMLWPAGVSRTLAVKTPKIAKQLFLWSTVPFLARRALPVFWGIGAYVFFFATAGPAMQHEFAAALQDGTVNTQAAMPLFLAKIIPTGLLGLVTAGMVAAFMSTHDSYLLCWSGVMTQDIIGPLFGPLSQRQRILTTRVSIVAIGLMLLFWGLWYELEGNLWGYMAVTGTIYLAGVLPVVIGGLYWRYGSSVGAYIALVLGTLGGLGLEEPVNWIQQASGLQWIQSGHMTLFAFAVSSLGYVVGSLAFPDNKPEQK